MDDEPAIIHDGKAVTADEYLRTQVEPRVLKPQHVSRVQQVIARRQVTHVVGRTGPKSMYHAIKRIRIFDAIGNFVGHDGTSRKAICRSDCTIVFDMASFDGCCDGLENARQCEKCLAKLNGEVD